MGGYAFLVVFFAVLAGGLLLVGWQLMAGVGPVDDGVTVAGTVVDTEFVERDFSSGGTTRTEIVALEVVQFIDPGTGMTRLVTGHDVVGPLAFGFDREVSLVPGSPDTARVLLDGSPTAGLVVFAIAGLVLLVTLWRLVRLVRAIRLLI